MKYFIFILLTTSFSLWGQKEYKYSYKQGYKFIRKADRKLKHNNLSKTKKFIELAKNSNYGFCGNAWSSAYSEINLIEVQILNKQKKYDESLTILDSLSGCNLGANCDARDSLKIITLFLKFGKEKVKNSFKKINSINLSNDLDFGLFPFYWVFLDDLNYKFRFNTSYNDSNNKKKTEDGFYNIAKNEAFYKLLQ